MQYIFETEEFGEHLNSNFESKWCIDLEMKIKIIPVFLKWPWNNI